MNYYNEFDHNAAEWLRQLIEDGLIPKGDVDERSITEVSPTDIVGYTQCHFFAGIGGWPLALQLAGWPEDRPVWTGSCPCQAFSTAGKQLGFADERDLWPVFRNLIAECRPDFVLGEQVENAIKHGWLDRVYSDLEAEKYAVGSVVLGAHSVGAPHRRYRLYWGAMRMANDVSRRCGAGGELGGVDEIRRSGADVAMQTAERYTCGGVADRDGQRLERKPVSTLSGRHDCAEVAGGGSDCGMADGANDGRDGRMPGAGGSVGQGECRGLRESAGESDDGGMANGNGERRAQGDGGELASGECRPCLPSLPPWSNFRFVYCRDNKVRRVPAESLFLGVADGVSERVDAGGNFGILETGGFPLTTQKVGRSPLLKGYGNAINPYCAKEFIEAFMEDINGMSI